MNNGYLVVASKQPNFYILAINLIESIMDHNPEAKCTLVTEERFVDHRADICDKVIICDDHYRAKLWGMAQSPYDITMYIDADCEVVHEDIAKVFDELGDHDLMFTYLGDDRKYVFKEVYFPAGRLGLCGGVCLYRSSKKEVLDFCNDWYELFKKQWNNEWWPKNEQGGWDERNYPRSLKWWDQFSLWWLINKDPKWENKLKIGIFPDDARWNWYTCYHDGRHDPKDPIVIMHYSNMAKKDSNIYEYANN